MKKFKKVINFIILTVLAMLITLSTVACGPRGEQIDPNKIQIYVGIANNGVGQNWGHAMAKAFNALPENQEYEVIIRPIDVDVNTAVGNVEAGVTDLNIHFGSLSTITPLIYRNGLIDLSDLYARDIDGDGTTLADKTFDYENVKKGYSNLKNEGIYAIPYAYGISGLVFDYKFFLDNEFLDFASSLNLAEIQQQVGDDTALSVDVDFDRIKVEKAFGNYKVGDYVLTKGKDGKYGTYDDGQRTTIQGFNELIARICDSFVYPYIYSTEFATAYIDTQMHAVFAQNVGLDNFASFMRYNGDIKAKNGTVQATLNLDNGYTAYDTDVIENAYRQTATFYRTNFMGKEGVRPRDKMLHPRSLDTTAYTHKQAQISFVSSFISGDSPDAAFLSEGCWWEGSECRETFNGLLQYNTNEDPRGYGNREYRYYLNPILDGQIMPENQSAFACMDEGCGVILNNMSKKCKTDEAKAAFIKKCKDFLAFTLTDENLDLYTRLSGGIPRPYDYQLSDETLQGLTPFQKNVWEISHDTEHIKVIRSTIYNNQQGIRSVKLLNFFQTNVNDVIYGSLHAAFSPTVSAASVEQYIAGIKTNVNNNYDNYKNDILRYL